MQDDEEEEDAEMVSQDAAPTPQDLSAGNLFYIFVEEDYGALNFIRRKKIFPTVNKIGMTRYICRFLRMCLI